MKDAQGKFLTMINGFPGDVPYNIADFLLEADKKKYPYVIHPHSITRPDVEQKRANINRKKATVDLHRHYVIEKRLMLLQKACKKAKCKGVVIIDCSDPSRIVSNLTSYCNFNLPSVIVRATNEKDEIMKMAVEELDGCTLIASTTDSPMKIFEAANFLLNNIQPGVVYLMEDVFRV